MKVAKTPEDELLRLATLKNYRILDTLPERDFDDFTLIASHICKTPIALISLIDETRQWFKSKIGLEASETPRDVAFCSHAILQDEVFIIPDSSKDERFHDNPLASKAPHVRFYAGAPLKTPCGSRIGTLCVIDHIPRELSNEQLASLKALARQVVNQLEMRLQKESILRSVQHAEDASKVKAKFLANMSHEIRTPLNGILGMISLLSMAPLDSETKNKFEIIKHCGTNLLSLVNDILDFSKIEAGKLTLELSAASLNDAIKNVVDLIRPSAEAKGLTLTYEITTGSEETSWFILDQVRLQQVLLNLITNAVKFTPEGSVLVQLEVESLDKTQASIHIRIVDTGIGMDEHAKEKLFQSFSQVDASTTRQFGGTGLGLAISKGIIEAMGGNIWAESVPGKGSTFHFKIRAERAEPIPQGLRAEVAQFDSKMAQRKPLKILIADDLMPNRLMAQSFLKLLGYTADCVCNGLEVLDAFNNKHYDVILMDCQMPEMDGFDATRKIKKRFSKKMEPWIIALTASAYPEDKRKCLDSGMDDFVPKPFDVQVLASALERVGTTKITNEPILTKLENEKDFDLALMQRNFAGDKDVMHAVLDSFVESYPKMLDELKLHLERNDFSSVAVLAHKLRGNLGTFYAKKAQEKLLRIETMARNKNLTDARPLLNEMIVELTRLKTYLMLIQNNRKAA